MSIFKIIGAIGLIFIIIGVAIKDRKKRDIVYILGGICLEIYSIYIKDNLFIILQAFFILVAISDFFRPELPQKENKILKFLKKITNQND